MALVPDPNFDAPGQNITRYEKSDDPVPGGVMTQY